MPNNYEEIFMSNPSQSMSEILTGSRNANTETYSLHYNSAVTLDIPMNLHNRIAFLLMAVSFKKRHTLQMGTKVIKWNLNYDVNPQTGE